MTIDHDYERFMVMKVLASNQAWNLLRDGTVMVIVTGHSPVVLSICKLNMLIYLPNKREGIQCDFLAFSLWLPRF